MRKIARASGAAASLTPIARDVQGRSEPEQLTDGDDAGGH